MNHDRICDDDVIGRYRLGQLSSDEDAAFETHLLECARCCALLEVESRLEYSLREIATASNASPGLELPLLSRQKKPTGARRATSLAIATLAVALLISSIALQSQLAPAPDLVFHLILARSAQAKPVELHVPADVSSYIFELDAAATNKPCCRVSIENADGRSVWTSDILIVDGSGRLRLRLDRNLLPSGEYWVVVRSSASSRDRLVEHLVRLQIEN